MASFNTGNVQNRFYCSSINNMLSFLAFEILTLDEYDWGEVKFHVSFNGIYCPNERMTY